MEIESSLFTRKITLFLTGLLLMGGILSPAIKGQGLPSGAAGGSSRIENG